MTNATGSNEAVSLHKVKGIALCAEIEVFGKIEKWEFDNFFRTFKKVEESTEENHYYSSCFASGDVISMREHYGDRINAMDCIQSSLPTRYSKVYLKYDFRFAAVNKPYCTDGEFVRFKKIIENCLRGTGLYLFFMVSHFNQLVGKPLRQKPEHYHLIIAEKMCDKPMSKEEYQQAIYKFADRLRFANISPTFRQLLGN